MFRKLNERKTRRCKSFWQAKGNAQSYNSLSVHRPGFNAIGISCCESTRVSVSHHTLFLKPSYNNYVFNNTKLIFLNISDGSIIKPAFLINIALKHKHNHGFQAVMAVITNTIQRQTTLPVSPHGKFDDIANIFPPSIRISC